ncbi:C39 family peptidase [Patescibacteria group bacterium]|nr:C39 family peptidase [Patescibacteria group bacterium]
MSVHQIAIMIKVLTISLVLFGLTIIFPKSLLFANYVNPNAPIFKQNLKTDSGVSNCVVVKVGNPTKQAPICQNGSDGTTGGSGPTTTSDVPLYKQWDPRWGKNSYGCGTSISSAGCGVTSLAMVISYWTGKEVLPSETAQSALNHGWRVCNQGTSWSAMIGMPGLYRLKSKSIGWEEAKRYLALNIPIIQSHAPGYFTNGGHFIVLTGISGTGSYLVNDPDGKHRTEASESQIKASLKSSWVITK